MSLLYGVPITGVFRSHLGRVQFRCVCVLIASLTRVARVLGLPESSTATGVLQRRHVLRLQGTHRSFHLLSYLFYIRYTSSLGPYI